MPTPLSQIARVENPNNLAINVYAWEDGHIAGYRLSKNYENQRKTANLSSRQMVKNITFHGTKKLDRLLYYQTKYEHRKYFCERCLHGFTREDLLDNHIFYCR